MVCELLCPVLLLKKKKRQASFHFSLFTICRSGSLQWSYICFILSYQQRKILFYAFTFNHELASGWFLIPLCTYTGSYRLRMHMNASTLNSESFWVIERAIVAVLPWGKQTIFFWTVYRLDSPWLDTSCSPAASLWIRCWLLCFRGLESESYYLHAQSWVKAILCQGIPYLLSSRAFQRQWMVVNKLQPARCWPGACVSPLPPHHHHSRKWEAVDCDRGQVWNL